MVNDILKKSKAPAAVRLIEILDLISKKGHASFTEISSLLTIPKSSTHHLLEVLCATRMLRQRVDGQYVLGLHLFELGGLVVSRLDIRTETIPYMHELMALTGLTCHSGIMEGNEAFYLSKIESSRMIIRTSWEGQRIKFHSTALGKILLAWRPKEQIDTILAGVEFVKNTETTILNKHDYLVELEKTKKRGWAIDDGENFTELKCFAAPVFNHEGEVLCAISVTGIRSQFTEDDEPRYLNSLLDITKKISKSIQLGLRDSE